MLAPARLVAYVNSIAATAILAIVMYYAHRMLQLQYYRYCRSDLIRVIFFHQSPICTHVTTVLNIVESAGNQVVKHVMDNVLHNGFFIGSDAYRQIPGAAPAQGSVLSVVARTMTDVVWRTMFPQSWRGNGDAQAPAPSIG